MQLLELWLKPFRNFTSLHLCFQSTHTLVFGLNGFGKSNILEAVSYLSIGKSIRGAKDAQAVPHEGDFFDIRGLYKIGSNTQKMRLFFGKKEGKKAFLDDKLNEQTKQKIGELKIQKPVEVLFEGYDTSVFDNKKPIEPTIKKVFQDIPEQFCFLFVGFLCKH